jgi:hypothetical protein
VFGHPGTFIPGFGAVVGIVRMVDAEQGQGLGTGVEPLWH